MGGGLTGRPGVTAPCDFISLDHRGNCGGDAPLRSFTIKGAWLVFKMGMAGPWSALR